MVYVSLELNIFNSKLIPDHLPDSTREIKTINSVA